MMAKALSSAVQLWRALQKQAGLQPKAFDSDLMRELEQALRLPNKGPSFERRLAAARVSIEGLVDAFLGIARPFVGMMVDILRMFQEAGAKRTRDNLRMRFDFGASTAALELDLAHFKEYETRWSRVVREVETAEWNDRAMWALLRALGNSYFHSRESMNLPDDWRRWLDEYAVDHTFPDWLPTRPSLNGAAALVVDTVWPIFRSFVEFMRTPRLGAGAPNDWRPRSLGDEDDAMRKLRFVETDYWAGSFLTSLGGFVESAGDDQHVASVLAAVEKIRELLPVTVQTVEERIEELFAILSLPVWKQRYEVYATWVGTRIVDALPLGRTTVHECDGEINFSFKGTHLATVEGPPGQHLYVWAELRSHHANPIGKSRKAGIQPDYTVARAPITDPRSSLLVVECKQYKKASRRNFSDALTDYASGRPNANVILVSYGPADLDLAKSVPHPLAHRTQLISRFRPGEDGPLAAFRGHVAGLTKALAEGRRGDLVASVELSWNEQPRDLDLYVMGLSDRNDWVVFYGAKGALMEKPWAEFGTDHINGYGPERVQFAPEFGEPFRCLVHNYSGERQLAGSSAKVVVDVGARKIDITIPASGDGQWWHAFDHGGRGTRVEIVNKIVADPSTLPGARHILNKRAV